MIPELEILPDADQTAAALVDALVALTTEARKSARGLHVGLTGGSMGVAVAQEIGRRWTAGEADFGHVDWWFSDERFLPAGHEERNARQVREALGGAPLEAERFHEMPACEADTEPDRMAAEDASYAYAQEMEVLPRADDLPVLDVVVLGVGPDAHVASLFPGHPDSAATGVWTTAVDDSPKPPPVRVSFTMPVVRAARQVWVVAAGEGKADALAAAQPLVEKYAGASVEDRQGEPLDCPVAWARGSEKTLWFLDEAAAG